MTKPKVKCDYCQGAARLVNGSAIYPHRPDLMDKKFWQCAPCKAYVGCHPDSMIPLGRLANAELRREKQKVHALFDPLWKSRHMKRSDAYAYLAKKLGMAQQNCHVGMFDVETCRTAVAVLNARYGAKT